MFHEISREIEGGSYELYAEVLRRTAIEIAKRLEWPLEPSRSGFLPDSVQRWKPFKETNTQLQKLAKKYKLGLLSNIDDKLLGQTRRHIPIDFDLVVTAQQVRSYKPELAHFTECARRMGGKRGWVHVAASHYHDVVPCVKQRVPVIWVNRNKETLDSSQKKPTAEVAQPQRGRQAARRHLTACGRVALHADVLVVTSAVLQVNCVIVRGRAAPDRAGPRRSSRRAGGETFVIDSPMLPEELDALRRAARAGRASPRPAGCSPRTATGTTCSGGSPSRASRSAAPRAPPSACRPRRARPSASCARSTKSSSSSASARSPWARFRRCRCPGAAGSASASSSCTRAGGHTARRHGRPGRAGRACCLAGDYLSPVELPMLGAGGMVEAYRDTLERLRPLVAARRARRPRPRAGARRGARWRSSTRISPICERCAARRRGRAAGGPALARSSGAARSNVAALSRSRRS